MREHEKVLKASKPLQSFIGKVRDILASEREQAHKVGGVKNRLEELLEQPSWLPEPCRQMDPQGYARHLMFRDGEQGFCIVAMVWGPGQGTQIHDHSGVWCVEGVYEGTIEVTRYDLRDDEGSDVRFEQGGVIRAGVGACGALIPPVEYHCIANRTERTAISLHIYGRDLDLCHVFRPLGNDLYRKETKRLSYHSVLSLSLPPS